MYQEAKHIYKSKRQQRLYWTSWIPITKVIYFPKNKKIAMLSFDFGSFYPKSNIVLIYLLMSLWFVSCFKFTFYLLSSCDICGIFVATSIGRSRWLSMISGSRLQPNCNEEGFNAGRLVRIGIMGNNENHCGSPDSYLGIGFSIWPYCQIQTFSGNKGCVLSCCPGSINIPANGYIFVK